MGNKKTQLSSILIDKSKNICEWVEIGVLSYKLCDRNFDCKNCPLDQVLRGFYDKTKVVNRNLFKYFSSLDHLIKIKQNENYYISPRHIWIEVLGSDEVKIGIDGVAAIVLGSIEEVKLPQSKEIISKGSCCGQIMQGEHIFSIPAPLDGEVKTINHNLGDFPDQLTRDPFNNGWIVSIKPDNLEQDLSFCRKREALFSWYLKEMKWLEYKLSESFQQNLTSLKNPLTESDTLPQNLKDYLPKEHYQNLVISVLGDRECK